MEAAELRQVSQAISSSVGGNMGQFRRATEEHEKNLFKIVKDLSNSFASQRRELSGLSSTLDETLDNESNQTEKINQTNSLIQDSISLQSQTVAEIKNLVFGLKSLNESMDYLLYNNNSPFTTLGKSLGDIITGGLGGLGNIMKGVGLLGGAGLAGAGLGYIAGSSPMGASGSSSEAMSFFQSKGWSKEQSAGIVGNLMVESENFSSDVISGKKKGDGGIAAGIAQWHPDRQAKFQQLYGKPLIGSSFKEQLEFVNWELNNSEKKAGDAIRTSRDASTAASLTDQLYERSSGEHRSKRIANANMLSGQQQTATPVTPSSGTETTPNATPVSQTPTTPETSHASAGHTDHGHEGIISGAAKGSMDAASAKSFLQSRQGGGGDFTGVNADKLNSEFAVKIANAIQQAEAATGSKAVITEGYRPPEVQAQYYANYIQQPVPWNGQMYYPQKKGGIAAPPGKSRHQRGLAVDLSDGPVRDWLAAHAGQLGLGRVPNDPPHFQGGGPGGEELGGSTPTSIPGALTPGSSPMPDMAARQAQLELLIASMGGGVPGYGAAAPPVTPETAANIPTGGVQQQAPMAAAAPIMGMLGGMGGVGGIASTLAPMLLSALSQPNITPSAEMMPDINAIRNASIVNQSEVLNQAEDYNYKQSIINSSIATNNESESLSGAQASMGTPTGHDYNAPWDLDFGPSWPELVSWAFPEVASKIKPSPYQR